MLTEVEVQAIKPLRHSRKVSDSGGLHLLVTPKGGRCWRFAYPRSWNRSVGLEGRARKLHFRADDAGMG